MLGAGPRGCSVVQRLAATSNRIPQITRQLHRRITSAATMTEQTRFFEGLKFENRSLNELPIDPIEENHVRSVAGAVWSRVKPTPVDNPHTVAVSESALELLDIRMPKDEEGRKAFMDEVALFFGGNALLPDSDPAAHCYAGHQFGSFAGQLGDGRAITLGEAVNSKGEHWELQLKGAGLTPYSRTADGRAVLRSSIREFLCSEHMWALGIPTTRAATLVTSDTTVLRDPLYDGRPVREKASIVLRLAPSFLRLGSWEVFKPTDPHTGRAGPSARAEHIPVSRKLLDFTIRNYFPEIWQQTDVDSERYCLFYEDVVKSTARLVADWQCVGFVHGVLNTDNLSVLGLTIDYGPFGFMDRFDTGFVPNHSDDSGRYSYRNQPGVCKWNLGKFAEALSMTDAVSEDTLRERLKDLYDATYNEHYMGKMRRKLGLLVKEEEGDRELMHSLLDTMEATGADFTNTFRALARLRIPGAAEASICNEARSDVLSDITANCCTPDEQVKAMKGTIPRETLERLVGLGEESSVALQMYTGKPWSYFKRQLDQLDAAEKLGQRDPCNKSKEDYERWKPWVASYEARLAREVEGAPAGDIERIDRERVECMNNNNPKFVLRNYLAQNAIEQAEKGNYDELHSLMRVLLDPYGKNTTPEDDKYAAKPPSWSVEICVSCSS